MDQIIEATLKFMLCVLNTQIGKTFTAISKICTELQQDDELGRSIHIIFTMNTLLNNKQFAKRLEEKIEKVYGKGSICVLSSKYDGKYQHVKNEIELQGICLNSDTCPRVVVMCSNKQRFVDGVEFLKVINSNRFHISRAFVYYDELHEYISDTLREKIEEIHNLEIVKSIVALTATPNKLFQTDGFWSKFRTIEWTQFNDKNYIGCRDMIFNCIDDFFETPYVRPRPFDYDLMDRHTIGFIEYVLTKHPEILMDNTRSFIPAHIRRVGHNAVRDLVFSLNPNSVVIVINGVEKTIQYIDNGNKKTLLLNSHDEEICETISRLVFKDNLQHRPIVITGYLCIGMGQTLTHLSLGSFTSAIFGHLDLTNDDIYQLFGRITGRMRDWDNYVRTQVYCPTTIMNRCLVMEECARNIVSNHNGDIITAQDYTTPIHEMGEVGMSAIDNFRIPKKKKQPISKSEDTDKQFALFDTQDQAIAYGRTTLDKKFNRRTTNLAPEELLTNGNNPTSEDLFKRMWGINSKNPARMIPTDQGKWCVYWRPSLITHP
jgi:hypothetical protein